jgi:hypothetical protein
MAPSPLPSPSIDTVPDAFRAWIRPDPAGPWTLLAQGSYGDCCAALHGGACPQGEKMLTLASTDANQLEAERRQQENGLKGVR